MGVDSMHVSIIIGEEDRKREAAFAEANGLPLELVRKAAEVTGIIDCGGGQATAQVTGAQHVLSTAAHIFMNTDTCERYGPELTNNCSFFTSHNPSKKYKIVPDSIRLGGCNPGISGAIDDWAVVRLQSPVENVEPLRLPPPRTNADAEIVMIAAVSSNFEGGALGLPTLEVCSVRLRYPSANVALATDCDSGPGTSGSAQLNYGTRGLAAALEKKEIGAINVAQTALADGTIVEGNDYDDHGTFNISVPVWGRFRDALIEAVASQ